MTLQKRVLITIGLTLVFLIALLFISGRIILFHSYVSHEQGIVYENVKRAQDALYNELSNLNETTRDWAFWDDTYNFIADANANYTSRNTIDLQFINTRLNLMLFVNSSGRIVYGKSFDLQAKKEAPLSNDLITECLSANSILVDYSNPRSGVSGIVTLPKGPMLISAYPIIKSDGTGSPRGTLIMGRYLDSPLVNRLAGITHLNIAIQPYDASKTVSFFKSMHSITTGNTTVFIHNLNAKTITGYTLLKDIYGNTALVLRVDMPNDLYQQSHLDAIYFLFSFLAIALVFIAVILKYVDKTVLSRLHQLSANVRSIGASGDLSQQVVMAGNDELASLTADINGMLEALKQSQREVCASEAQLRRITDNMQDMVSQTDAGGILQYASPSHDSILGYQPEDLLGKSIYDYVHPDDLDRVVAAVQTALGISSSGKIEYRYRHADGYYKWIETTGKLLFDDKGMISGAIFGSRDITERKKAEEELAKYREHLEELVNERTATLQELNEQLELEIAEKNLANKELESFSYSVSHDLRAPLRIIDGYSQLLYEDYHDRLDDEGKEHLRVIRSQCQRMSQLINGLLDLSRLSRKEMLLEEVNLSQMAEEIAAGLRAGEPERQVSFVIAPGLKARGDSSLLKSVLENLLNNAWKFTGKNPEAKIEFGVTNINRNRAYFVRDDGVGFDMKYAHKLFVLFQRLHTINEFPGNGIGLATVQRIIQRHGGRIWAEGAVEKGATFYFTLSGQISNSAPCRI